MSSGLVRLTSTVEIRLLEQVVPKEDTSLDDEPALFGLRSVPPLHEKPAFSLPLMTANFRRFNSRYSLIPG